MKKIIAFSVCLMLFFSVRNSVYALNNSPNIIDNSIYIQGIELSKSELRNLDNNLSIIQERTNEINRPVLTIRSINMNGNIDIITELSYQGKDYAFTLSGNAYKGVLSQICDSKDIVLDVTSSDKRIKVRYCELIFDNSGNSIYCGNEYSDIMKLYLEIDDQIVLFESHIPDVLKTLDNEELKQVHDPIKAFLWMADIIEPEIEFIKKGDAEKELQIRAGGDPVVWSNGTSYQTTYSFMGETYVFTSIPGGQYKITNINSADYTWSAEFYVSESVTFNGVKINGIDNVIHYKDIKISMILGANSMVERSFISGRVASVYTLTDLMHATARVLSSTTKWWNYGTNVFMILNSLQDNNNTVTLGPGNYDLYPSGTTGFQHKVTNYRLFKNGYSNMSFNTNGHYIIVQGIVHSNNTSGSTYGGVRFEWDALINASGISLADDAYKQYTKIYSTN